MLCTRNYSHRSLWFFLLPMLVLTWKRKQVWKMLPQACGMQSARIMRERSNRSRMEASTLYTIIWWYSLFFSLRKHDCMQANWVYSRGHISCVFHSVAFRCKIAHKVWCLSQDISWRSMALNCDVVCSCSYYTILTGKQQQRPTSTLLLLSRLLLLFFPSL